MTATPSATSVSTKQQRIAELARAAPEMALTTLSHHVDVAWLHEAYRRVRKDGAVGVDGQAAADYGRDLERNLGSLLNRFKSGTYRAPPVRRVHIPKGDGSTRPIGIPTLEDKILQRAVVMLLEPIYEQDFMDCSYGFRPGRSAHMALEALWSGLMEIKGGWVLEVDIRAFFDSVDHAHLRSILDRRVRDGVVRRVIDKWLKAGVWERGAVRHPELGTPQGGVISPLLANIYLHEVVDRWFHEQVRPRLRGGAFLIRYADDFSIAFERVEDARRVHSVLPKRFGKYGLTLHPEKTRLLDFRRPRRRNDEDGGGPRSRSFELLGFSHFWAKSRTGRWVVRRKTASSRLHRAVKRIGDWCRAHRHAPVAIQHAMLSRKVRGHYAYYGITGNAQSLGSFLHAVERVWHKWLDRRSRARMSWERFRRLLQRFPLPRVRVVHSVYPRAAKP
jgi:RNA-directed DNA polymerase